MDFQNSTLLQDLSPLWAKIIDPILDEELDLEFFKQWQELSEDYDYSLYDYFQECHLFELEAEGLTTDEYNTISNWLTDEFGCVGFTPVIEPLGVNLRQNYVLAKVDEWQRHNVGQGLTMTKKWHPTYGWDDEPSFETTEGGVYRCTTDEAAIMSIYFYGSDHDSDSQTRSVNVDDLCESLGGFVHPYKAITERVREIKVFSSEPDKVSSLWIVGNDDEVVERLRLLIQKKFLCSEVQVMGVGSTNFQLKACSIPAGS